MAQTLHNLRDMIDVLKEAAESKESVVVDDILDTIGRRSFGPLLLFVGIVMSTPIPGDIPGVPSICGAIVLIVSIQLLVGREHIWLPQFILTRSVKSQTVKKGLAWCEKPARYVDKVLKRRLTALTGHIATYAMILLSSAIAILTPFMEVVPLSANVAGLVYLCFSLSLIAYDGALALAGFLVSIGLFGLLAYAIW